MWTSARLAARLRCTSTAPRASYSRRQSSARRIIATCWRTAPAGSNLLAESVGYDNIRLEATVAGFNEDQDRVTVRFADGSTEDADLLIGPDGLYSKVRAQLFP